MIADQHPRQEERLAALARYDILDTDREEAFDEVVALVAELCDAPIAVVNLIDADRQWFKAEVGLGVRSTPLDTSLCSHVIREEGFVEISDTLLDPRMSDNPLCSGQMGLRFYAGATLRTDDGLPIGTLCVLDHKPRRLNALQRRAVEVLAAQVMRQLELRLALRREDVLRREIDHRVKNSLASVAAMVSLQVARASSAEARDALLAVQGRLSVMSSLHEQLHRASDGECIQVQAFLDNSGAMMGSLLPPSVEVRTDVAPLVVRADRASLIGIIVNEFVANSAKHAFGAGQRGCIRISGRRQGSRYILECDDDGQGCLADLPEDGRSNGLGTRIIRATASSLKARASWTQLEP